MATLTELKSADHPNLHIAPNAMIDIASKQHMLNVQAIELANAATCFPVFISRNTTNGRLGISALTSLHAGENLFIRNQQWEPVFQPLSVRSLPLYLMQKAEDPTQFTVGFDAQSEHFSTTEGTPLFSEDGQATETLKDKSKVLETELMQYRQSFAFLKAMEELDLLKQVDLQVQFQSGHVNVVQGLYTINEDRLQTMEAEQFEKLRTSGYLMPIHALLMSLFQVNVLVSRHNAAGDKEPITAVKIEVSKNLTSN